MTHRHGRAACLAAGLIIANVACLSAAEPDRSSKVQKTLQSSAEQRKFTFILFWRENNAATKAMHTTLQTELAARGETATFTTVQITDTAEKPVVDQFQVSRSPMPLALAIAPNGAVTGVFPEKVTREYIDASFATPRMTECMKAMQSNKLVLLCVQPQATAVAPRGVRDFQADPHFQQRTTVLTMLASDPAEKKFMAQLGIDPQQMKGPVTVFMAPPAVMVGKFTAEATKEQLAQKLSEAGKCCDDPNCKHHQQGR